MKIRENMIKLQLIQDHILMVVISIWFLKNLINLKKIYKGKYITQ